MAAPYQHFSYVTVLVTVLQFTVLLCFYPLDYTVYEATWCKSTIIKCIKCLASVEIHSAIIM